MLTTCEWDVRITPMPGMRAARVVVERADPDEAYAVELLPGADVRIVAFGRPYRAVAARGARVEGVFGWADGASEPELELRWRHAEPPTAAADDDAQLLRIALLAS